MQTITNVDSEKLRGGFYTPPSVVDFCLQKLAELRPLNTVAALLEPSCGDGAFLRGLGRRSDAKDVEVTCIEVAAEEAAKCQAEMWSQGLKGSVVSDSFFAWAGSLDGPRAFDAVVGNPPFVRYQFVPATERDMAECRLRDLGLGLAGVSNLWIPFVLLSLRSLKPGGVFALVLPQELLATVSAIQVRSLLVSEFDCLAVDLFPRATFPDILQDVLVISGMRRRGMTLSGEVHFAEHSKTGKVEWTHKIDLSELGWTRYLLEPQHLVALSTAESDAGFVLLGLVARLQVALVTGANAFFTVDSTTVHDYGLHQWARPMLARSEDSPGIVFTKKDHESAGAAGKRAWFLDFGPDNPDPKHYAGASAYLDSGEEVLLHERYKCRIRNPWYRVPHVRSGDLMMSKRAHQHHRLFLNEAHVLTTDTIYRGEMTPSYRGRESDLVAGFHNSLTLLLAEVEGRTYGGGVLELVPSEIARLRVPVMTANGHLDELDRISRSTGGQRDVTESIVQETDSILASKFPLFSELVDALSAARSRLRRRRFAQT